MRTAFIGLACLCFAACAPPPAATGRIQPGTPHRPYDADGDGRPDGEQYDLDGDGSFDAVDLDGDGLLDGGDFDGDGQVTVFGTLGTGLTLPSAAELELYADDVDPDLEGDLEPGKADGPSREVVTMSAVDLSTFLPRPANQGQLGSCAAFATAAAATGFRAAREQADPNQAWASPSFLYARMLEQGGNQPCDAGTTIFSGLATLVSEGATPLARLGYDGQSCVMNPAAEEAHPYRIGTFTVLDPFSRDKAKEHLSAGAPLVFGVTLPPNFGRLAGPEAKNVFKSDTGQLGGKHGGGHAMVMVGYDDARGAYRVHNSWGTDWGDGGYMWWDYSDLEGRDGFHALAATSAPELPAPPMFVDEANLQISADAAIVARGKSGDRLVVRVRANAPLFLSEVAVDDQSPRAIAQYLAYGNVGAASTAPLAPGPHTLKLSGQLMQSLKVADIDRQPAFTRTLSVTVGAPVSDPDGRL
jgi:hypothetical protein